MRVSVLVTSYNYENYITETLTSLLNQTTPIYEIVIIDDGSTDGSPRIISQIAKGHKNIKFIQHEDFKNHGLPASLQRGIQFISGDYVAFCESDDYWDKGHYESLINFLKQNKEANFVVGQTKVINPDKHPDYKNYVNYTEEMLKRKNRRKLFDKIRDFNVIPTFSSVCVKTSLLRKCNFCTPLPQYIDFWLWRQILSSEPCFYCDSAITHWRKHPLSYDQRENITDLEHFIALSDNIIQTPLLTRYIGKLIRTSRKVFQLVRKVKVLL